MTGGGRVNSCGMERCSALRGMISQRISDSKPVNRWGIKSIRTLINFPPAQPQTQPSTQSSTHPPPVPPKKDHRAALRSYYGIARTNTSSSAGPASDSSSTTRPGHGGGPQGDGDGDGQDDETKEGVLDQEDLDAQEFVERLLREEDFWGLLKGVGKLGDGGSSFYLFCFLYIKID